MMRWCPMLYPPAADNRLSVGLLALRLVTGAAMMMHGWPKIQDPLGWMGEGAPFPAWLLAMAAISEFGGGLCYVLGLLTPLAALLMMATMAVAAATHIGRGDPFVGQGPSYELALVYLTISLLILLAGPGRFSLDGLGCSRKTAGSGDCQQDDPAS